jgi:hypothetical protein
MLRTVDIGVAWTMLSRLKLWVAWTMLSCLKLYCVRHQAGVHHILLCLHIGVAWTVIARLKLCSVWTGLELDRWPPSWSASGTRTELDRWPHARSCSTSGNEWEGVGHATGTEEEDAGQERAAGGVPTGTGDAYIDYLCYESYPDAFHYKIVLQFPWANTSLSYHACKMWNFDQAHVWYISTQKGARRDVCIYRQESWVVEPGVLDI